MIRTITYQLWIKPCDTKGRRFLIVTDMPSLYRVAWAQFQHEHRLGGLTVFRRWLSIFHPHVTVDVYTRGVPAHLVGYSNSDRNRSLM